VGKIYFVVGVKEISPEGMRVIVETARMMIAQPALKYDLSGYADRTGNPDANLELAKQRAFAVRDALKAAGVAEARINLKKPEFVIGTADAESRRVDIVAAP
jgi:outer membrane protein OmpA-like peptidoglycan-associated protein